MSTAARHLSPHAAPCTAAAVLTTHSCAQLLLQPYLIQQRISLFLSLPPVKPLDCTKQHEVLSASQVVPQHVKLGADPHQPPHPVQAPLVGDAATVHHRFPSCGRQDACQAVNGGGLACSIGTQQTETFTCSNITTCFACCAHCAYGTSKSNMHLATCLQLHLACYHACSNKAAADTLCMPSIKQVCTKSRENMAQPQSVDTCDQARKGLLFPTKMTEGLSSCDVHVVRLSAQLYQRGFLWSACTCIALHFLLQGSSKNNNLQVMLWQKKLTRLTFLNAQPVALHSHSFCAPLPF